MIDANDEWETVNPGGGEEFPETISIQKQEVGFVFEGKYLSSKEIRGMDDKPQKVHEFDVEGEEKNVWGFTNLDRILSQVEKGSILRITYEGKKAFTAKNGAKRTAHQVKVQKSKIPF
jgi:hypothetical protein